VEFYSWEIGGGSGDFADVDNFIATDCESNAIHVGFVGFEGCYDAEIGGNTARWLVGVSDEPHGVGAGGGVREATLREATNFEGGSVHPFDGVGSLEECWVFEDGAGVGIDDGEGEVLDRWVRGVDV
jgi:hypothetical protein